MDYRCIKASINQFCKNEFLVSKLNDIVLNSTKVRYEAHAFANLHILRLLKTGRPLPKLNQSFFQDCCSCVSQMYKMNAKEQTKEDLIESLERYKKCRPENYNVAYRDNIAIVFNYIAKEMETATINHLVLNFYKRFNRYLEEKYPQLSSTERYKICTALYQEDYEGDDPIVIEYRTKLNNQPPYDKFVKKDASYILGVYYEILTFAEQQIALKCNKGEKLKRKRMLRTFALLPQKSGFQMSYITVDKSVLRDIIIGEHLVKHKYACKRTNDIDLMTSTELRKDIDANPRKYWDQFFNIDVYETNKRKFNYFMTDGKTVSICFEVSKQEEKIVIKRLKKSKKVKTPIIKALLPFDDYSVVKACDPGMKFIMTTIDNQGSMYQYSTKRYYHDAGTNKTNFQRKKCYAENPAFLEYIKRMPSQKTASLNKQVSYIRYALKGLDNALSVNFKNKLRQWRFRDFIKKQKTFNEICKKLSTKKTRNEEKKVLFGIGDWSNPRDTIIRGNRRGPVTSLTNELSRWCEVIKTPERFTSRCCSQCHYKNDKKVHNKKSYRVFSCQNCENIMDRDKNACTNIMMVLERLLKGNKLPETFL